MQLNMYKVIEILLTVDFVSLGQRSRSVLTLPHFEHNTDYTFSQINSKLD